MSSIDNEIGSQHSPLWVDEDDVEASSTDPFLNNRIGGVRLFNRAQELDLDSTSAKKNHERLREKYKITSIIGNNPKWAREKRKRDYSNHGSESDEELCTEALQKMTRSTGNYIAKSNFLQKKNLTNTLLKDITIGHALKGQIRALKFHPLTPILITASHEKISLFKICDDGLNLSKGNLFLQDVEFPKLHIDSVNFFNDGLSLLINTFNFNRKNSCFSYDLVEGKKTSLKHPIAIRESCVSKVKLSSDGIFIAYMTDVSDVYVYVLKTLEHLKTFRSNDKMIDFCFCPTRNNTLFGFAENGTIYIWNINQHSNQCYFNDEGCVRATCLSASANGQFIACGSNTGIVNVYETSAKLFLNCDQTRDTSPSYTLTNLTTSVSFVRFSADAQLMVFGSDVKHMAAKMLHSASGTVYQNFPSKHEMFSRDKLKCAAFSPKNAFFAFGTSSGKCRLYRLPHFDMY